MMELHDVTKVYQQGRRVVQAVRGVSLTIAAGEFVSIMGPSGSGKSTLLHLLGGLDTPTTGRVLFAAAEVLAAAVPWEWGYDVLMLLIGAAIQLFVVSSTVYVQKHTSDAQRAHALSAYNAGFMGFVPAGSFVVAGLAALGGTRAALIIPGAVILACGSVLLASAATHQGQLIRHRDRGQAPALLARIPRSRRPSP